MYQIDGVAHVAQPYAPGRHFPLKSKHKEAKHQHKAWDTPEENSSESQDIDVFLGKEENTEKKQRGQGAQGGKKAGQASAAVETVYASGCIIAENPQEEFQHDRISVKGKGSKGNGEQIVESDKGAKEPAADQSPESVAYVKGNKKQKVEKHFAVYGPADAHQGLEDAAADVKGDEQEAFYEKYGLRRSLFKHAGEQHKDCPGKKGHDIVKGKDADQSFSEKKTGVPMGGKHNHKAADAEKDIHAEGPTV